MIAERKEKKLIFVIILGHFIYVLSLLLNFYHSANKCSLFDDFARALR